MTLHPCQVTGTLVAPDGSPLPEVQVQFLPAPVSMRAAGQNTLAPHPVLATTDMGAGLEVALMPGVYTVRARAPEGREYPPFLIDVPGQASAAIADILLHLPAPQSVYDAAASARMAGRAAGDAATHAQAAASAVQIAETSAATAQSAAVTAQTGLQAITDGALQSAASATSAASAAGAAAGSAGEAAVSAAQAAGSVQQAQTAATAAQGSAQDAGLAAGHAQASATAAQSAAVTAQTGLQAIADGIAQSQDSATSAHSAAGAAATSAQGAALAASEAAGSVQATTAAAAVAQTGAQQAQTGAQQAQTAAGTAQTSAQAADAAAGAAQTSAQAAGTAAAAALSAGRAFASRAAFQAAHLPDGTDSWSVLQAGHLLHYVRDANGTAIESANGVKGSPVGAVYPEHWADNTTPGVTDMSDAIEAAMNWSPAVRLLAREYRVTRTLQVRARDAAGLEGMGYGSVLRVDGGDFDVLRFFTGETTAAGVPLSCRGVRLRHFRMENHGAERSGGFMITSQERLSDSLLENITLVGPWGGIDLAAPLQVHLSQVYVSGAGRVSTGGPGIRITARPEAGVYDPNSHTSMAKAAGVYLHRCDVAHRNPGLLETFSAGLLIESADGVYVHQSHFQGGTNAVVIRNSGAPAQVMIGVVDFVGVYFDNSAGGHVRFEGLGEGVSVTLPGATQPVVTRFRSISFTKCQFRAAFGAEGSMSFDGITAGSVNRVSVNGSEFRLNNRSGIRDTIGGARNLKVSDSFFYDNNRDDQAGEGDIIVTDRGHLIRANDHIGGGAAGYGIRVLEGPAGGGGGTVVAANRLLESAASLARRIDAAAGVVVELNRIAEGQIAVEIVEQGSGPLGEWVRYSDGRMVVTRQVTVTGVNCDVVHASGRRSGNLLGPENRNFPVPFLPGTVPLVFVQARPAAGIPMSVLLGGLATNAAPFDSIRLLANAERLGFDAILEVRAEGRWR